MRKRRKGVEDEKMSRKDLSSLRESCEDFRFVEIF